MKILLISANHLTAPYPVYPLGLDYVAAAVGPGHAVRIADVNLLEVHHGLAETLGAFGPDVVGLSLRNIDNTDRSAPAGFVGGYRALAGVIRRTTRAPLVLGGSGFTLFPRELMAALNADYGIVGEGERFGLLVAALDRGEAAPEIPGLILSGGRRAVPGDAAAPWDGRFTRRFDPAAAHVAYYLERGGMLNLQTRRGCPFRCVYCTYPHIEGRRLRCIPPETVARTAMALQEAGARYLFVTDSAFNADYDHSAAVARAFLRSGLSIPWGAFFMPTRPPGGYYQELAEAGLRHVEFGTESLSDPVLAAYGKPFRAAHAVESHRAALAAGLYAAHYFLLGGPGETRATLARTLSYIDKLEKTVLFFFSGMRIYPHTRLHGIAIGEGCVSPGESLLAPVFYRSQEVDETEIIAAVEQRCAGRPNWVIGAGGPGMAGILERMYERGFSGPLWEHLGPVNWHIISSPRPQTGGGWRARAEAPPDSPWFSGHFPGNPILPGIAQLSMVVEILRAVSGPLRVSGLRRVRFKQVIRPGDTLDILVRPDPRAGDAAHAFQIRAGGEIVCSGLMTVEPGGAGAPEERGG